MNETSKKFIGPVKVFKVVKVENGKIMSVSSNPNRRIYYELGVKVKTDPQLPMFCVPTVGLLQPYIEPNANKISRKILSAFIRKYKFSQTLLNIIYALWVGINADDVWRDKIRIIQCVANSGTLLLQNDQCGYYVQDEFPSLCVQDWLTGVFFTNELTPEKFVDIPTDLFRDVFAESTYYELYLALHRYGRKIGPYFS